MSDEVATGDVDCHVLGNVAVAAVHDFEGECSLHEGGRKGEGDDSKISGIRRDGVGIDFPARASVSSENLEVEGESVIIKAGPVFYAGDVTRSGDGEIGVFQSQWQAHGLGRVEIISQGDRDGSPERAEWTEGYGIGIGIESGDRALIAGPAGAGTEVGGGDDQIGGEDIITWIVRAFVVINRWSRIGFERGIGDFKSKVADGEGLVV